MPHPVFLLYVLVKNIVSCMQAVLFLGRVNFEMRLQRKQQLGAGMCFNSYITYFDTGVLITCSPFPTSQRTRLWFSSHFFLCVISDFFPCHFLALHHLLPRFPIQRLKFGSCTQHLRLFQLHPIFFFFASKQSLNQRVASLCFLSNSQ